MPQPGKAERLLARAFSKRGIWFKPQITIRVLAPKTGEWKRQIDFMLKRSAASKQKKLVVEINGDDNHAEVNRKADAIMVKAGYAVLRFDQEVVIKSPDAIVKSIVNRFSPLKVSEVNRSVQSEMRDVRKILKTAHLADLKAAKAKTVEAGNDVTK